MKQHFIPILTLAALLLAACTPVQAPPIPSNLKSGGELVVALVNDIVALDPAFAYDDVTNQVVNAITEPLLTFNADGTLAPGLAERWENPDPLTYLYHLRQGVTFQDGSPMTIDDVLFSLERLRDPAIASPMGWMYANIESIQAVDVDTIAVHLKQPDTLWQYTLATTAGHVISKTYYLAHQATFGKPEGGLLGTGPFQFVSWATGSEIVLERNEQYWDKANGGPYLDRVVYKVVPDPTTRIVGLKTGELHLAFTRSLPHDQFPVIQAMENVTLTFADSFLFTWIAFNHQRPPFDNLKVRQALHYLLDRSQLTQTMFGEAATIARSPVPPALWVFERKQWQAAYEQLPQYSYDLVKAKTLLAESGVADQLNGKVILVDQGAPELTLALTFQAAAAEIGIDFVVEKMPAPELTTRMFDGTHDYDMVAGGWFSDFPDPAGNLLPIFHSGAVGPGGANASNYRNPEVDQLLDEQNALSDNSQRTELLIQVQKLLMDDAVLIEMSYPKFPMALNKDFTGYTITPNFGYEAHVKNIRKVR